VRQLTVDPYLSNKRAIAAWKKAGFQPVKEHEPDEEHAVPWLLMSFDQSQVLADRMYVPEGDRRTP
jgi:hypothetical protein